MHALDSLVRQGKVRAVGVSNFTLDQIRECGSFRSVDIVQYGLNMFDRRMEQEIFPYCQQQGTGVMVDGPLACGLLSPPCRGAASSTGWPGAATEPWRLSSAACRTVAGTAPPLRSVGQFRRSHKGGETPGQGPSASSGGWTDRLILAGATAWAGMKAFTCSFPSILRASSPVSALPRPAPRTRGWTRISSPSGIPPTPDCPPQIAHPGGTGSGLVCGGQGL